MALLALNLAGLILLFVILSRSNQNNSTEALSQLGLRLDALDQALSSKFSAATADMASRLEQTKGDLRQQVTDRLAEGFNATRAAVEQQLKDGRLEQSEVLSRATQNLEQRFEQLSLRQSAGLTEARTELTNSLSATTAQLRNDFSSLDGKMRESLEAMRAQVDQKLLAITQQVQEKLDQNIKEGFAQFEKVQQHLKAAEEQLRQVGVLGNSINDLNNLLKLPHLRGKFGEASLERLLADFLPAHMYELQTSVSDDRSRADAIIHFPDRKLPVDAKFPREQVLALFESNDESQIAAARVELVRVLKTEAKRIHAYIQPEHGTMDVALMYLPSETLYVEAIRSSDAMEALGNLRVFPVSPNTLLMTLKTIALAYKWYEVAARFEETREEIAKAQKSLGHFQKQFDIIGKSLESAQKAYSTASTHLKQYRNRVTAISGEEVPEVETDSQRSLPSGFNLTASAGGNE